MEVNSTGRTLFQAKIGFVKNSRTQSSGSSANMFKKLTVYYKVTEVSKNNYYK